MRFRQIVLPLVAALTLGGLNPAIGDASAVQAAQRIPASQANPASPIDDPQLRDEIARVVNRARAAGTDADRASISVEVLHEGFEAAISARIVELGGTVSGTAAGTLIQAAMPVEGLNDLALSDGVVFLRKTRRIGLKPQNAPAVGAVATSAVTITNANAWHAASITGANVKIGIIDYFSPQWTAMQSAGDVPAPAGTMCRNEFNQNCAIFDPNEEGHGNAVAETIYDMAPGAQLYIATAYTTTGLSDIIEWFKTNGVTIVSRSLGDIYDGPGTGTGPLDTLAAKAASYGMLFLNAAGNEAQENYWRGPWRDANNNGYLEFHSNGDERLRIHAGFLFGSTSGVMFAGGRWSDWGAAATRTNYDFEVWSNGVKVFPTGEGPNQTIGAPAIELDGIYSETAPGEVVEIRVRKRTAGTATTTGDILELMVWSGTPEYWQSPYSASIPIVDSATPGVLGIGAVDPAAGNVIASYSSQGPTNDGRVKPDLSAPSCFTSSIYSGAGNCFAGTSAATPVVAGAAALLRQRNLAKTGRGYAALLRKYTTDLGVAGADSVFGSGKLRLPAPPAAVVVNATPSVYTPIVPVRMLDSRNIAKAPAGAFGPYRPDSVTNIPIRNVAPPGTVLAAPVPANATAVAINLTAVGATRSGYTQVIPTLGATLESSSTLNSTTATTIQPNFAIVPIGMGGALSIFTTSGGNYIIDVLGYFTPSGSTAAGRLIPLDPVRVLDTSADVAVNPELLPSGWTNHKPAPGETVQYDFKGSGPLPATGASGVVLSVTGASPTGSGHVTVYPTAPGTPTRPLASLLNLTPGGQMTNLIVVPLGTDGTTPNMIDVFTLGGTHLRVDLVGYITDATATAATSGRFVPITPGRLFDSRLAPNTILAANTPRLVTVVGAAPVGSPVGGVSAVSFNVTAVNEVAAGEAVVYAGDLGAAPLATTLSWPQANIAIAAGFIGRIGGTGTVQINTTQQSNVILDANGYFTN